MDWKIHVVQVTPPGSACSVVFGTGMGSRHGPGSRTPGPDPEGRDFSSFVFFEDPDGNSWPDQQLVHHAR